MHGCPRLTDVNDGVSVFSRCNEERITEIGTCGIARFCPWAERNDAHPRVNSGLIDRVIGNTDTHRRTVLEGTRQQLSKRGKIDPVVIDPRRFGPSCHDVCEVDRDP